MEAPPVDPAVRTALDALPRDEFKSAELSGLDYGDPQVELAEAHSLPPVEVIAAMVSALQLHPGDRVLEIGTGSGYVAAVLGRLAGDVFTLERIAPVAALASIRLQALGCSNVQVRQADGVDGWAEAAPFDAILVSGSGTGAPKRLREQLRDGGRLVLPVGPHRERQTLVRITRHGSEFREERLGEVRFIRRLGDILVDLGALPRPAVEEFARESGGRKIGETLHDRADVGEAEVFRALALQRGIRFGTFEALVKDLDLECVRSVTRAFAEHNRILPLARKGDRLVLGVANPSAEVGELSKMFHPARPELVLVTPADFTRLLKAADLKAGGQQVEYVAEKAKPVEDVLARRAEDLDARFVSLFDSILIDAISARASDVHLERYDDRVRVRLRVDGDLHNLDRYALTVRELAGVVNVIKIRADIDIAEHRLPQGGRIRLNAGAHAFDLRVQTQPTLHGEHVVIRLLPQDVKLLSVEDLGFRASVAKEYRRLLDAPNGLVLVVGPTGSGKTTTLYAGLQILARDATRKVITAEDPIEYSIDDIQQTQVRPEIGFAFADAMRSFVRQDPDVILVGEIRDAETALEAIRASQTGHLVFSTLHCNDAIDAVQRLFDLGMHANSISSELLAVIAQRLAKRLCDACRVPDSPDPELLAEVFPKGPPKDFKPMRGSGCPRCHGYGTKGRIAVIEFLRANARIRKAIARRPAVDELRDLALDAGLSTMRDNFLELVNRGLVAFSEIPMILPPERLAPERGGA